MKKLILFFTTFLFAFNPPKLNEPVVFDNYEIPAKYKNDISQKYDVLSLNKVLKSAMQENKNSAYYQKKIDFLLSDIKNDKYNFDIYATAYARTGRITSNKYGSSAYTEEGATLNADKLLYDGDYFLTQKYDVLNKRLALIREINTKKRLQTLIITDYINLYFSQESLKVLKKEFKKSETLFEKIKNRYKKQKISELTFITAKTDLLNLKDLYAIALKNYIHNDFVLRQILNSHSQKPFLLQPFDIKLKIDKFPLLQKNTLKGNGEIARESNTLKLRQTDYLSQKRRFQPTINFTSFVGYGFTKNKEFDMSHQGEGSNWELALTLRQPIYNRNDIRLNTQSAKYNILLQKEKLKSTQKTTLINLENLYRNIQLLTYRIEIQKEKTKLLFNEINIYQKRFLQGMISYDIYSTAFNNYINSLQKLETFKRQKAIDKLLLSMIVK
jgi:hypothetical protein